MKIKEFPIFDNETYESYVLEDFQISFYEVMYYFINEANHRGVNVIEKILKQMDDEITDDGLITFKTRLYSLECLCTPYGNLFKFLKENIITKLALAYSNFEID